MKKFLQPTPGAVGYDDTGKKVSLDGFRGWLVRRASRGRTGGVVVALSTDGQSTVYLLVSEEAYRECVTIEPVAEMEVGGRDEPR